MLSSHELKRFAPAALGAGGAWRRVEHTIFPRIAAGCSLFVMLLAILTVSEYVFGVNLGIDDLPFPGSLSAPGFGAAGDRVAPACGRAGRMLQDRHDAALFNSSRN